MPTGKNEVAKLVKKMRSPDSFDREIAVAKLAFVRGSAVIEHLGSAASSDASPSVRRRAVEVLAKKMAEKRLAKAGQAAVVSLLGKAAADESPRVARVAVEALEKKGGEEVVSHLFGALDSPDRDMRILAINALVRVGARLKGSEVSGKHAKALLRVYPFIPAASHSESIIRVLKDALEDKITGRVSDYFEARHRERIEKYGNRVPRPQFRK